MRLSVFAMDTLATKSNMSERGAYRRAALVSLHGERRRFVALKTLTSAVVNVDFALVLAGLAHEEHFLELIEGLEKDEARRPVRHAKKGPRRMAPQPPVYSYAARRAHSSV